MKRVYILFVVFAAAIASFSFTSAQDPALKKSMEAGKSVYDGLCMACHLNEGQGIAGVFPPLAKSDFLMKDADRAIKILIHGQDGELTVNGKKYNGAMPATGLEDKDIADVLNYVRNSWGNKDEKMITAEKVAKIRAEKK